MTRTFFIFFTFLTFCLSYAKTYDPVTLPHEMYISERWLSWKPTFDVTGKDSPVAFVEKTKTGHSPVYSLFDDSSMLQATAEVKFFRWGSVVTIFDKNGDKLGSFEEDVFDFRSEISRILNPSNKLVGYAKMNFWGTDLVFSEPDSEHVIASLSRPAYSPFAEYWKFNIYDTSYLANYDVDPLFFALVAVYQTDYKRNIQTHDELGHFNYRSAFKSFCDSAEKSIEKEFNALLDELTAFHCSSIKPKLEEIEGLAGFAEEFMDTIVDEIRSHNSKATSEALKTLRTLLSSDLFSEEEKIALHREVKNFIKTEMLCAIK